MATSIKILTRRAAMTLILAILTASTAWAQAQATIGGITYDADGGYYVIDEPDDLRDLATYVNGTGKYRNNSTETTAHDCSGLKFKMTQDITFTYTTAWNDATSTENNFVAIGGYYDSNDRYFRGDFDGAGHTISGIRIYRSGTGYANVYQGIFGQTKGANIHGLRLADARITGYDYTGGIVGYNDGTVTDCHVANNVCIHAAQTEALYHGGIVGYNNGTVESCTSTATLTIASIATGCEDYGAIVGYNNFGTLRDNLAIGATVPAADSNTHGAIVGYNTSNGTLQRNYYTACKVASENVTPSGKGCQNADVTANDGAVSAHVVILPDGVTATATTGIAYDGNFYTTSGTTITLSNTAPAPAGYQYDGYTASAGTLSGSTLTMPAADVTISVVLAAIPWAGDGSSSSPYIIEYPSQLDLLAHRVNGTHGQTLQSDGYSGKYFRLANDIAYTATTAWNDANSTEDNYEAIGYYYDGTNYRYFSGNFDGAGHTISGIRIHHSGSTNADRYQGVFGRTGSGANIHHLRLDDARITGYARTSGIVGYNYGGSTVTDCHVASDVCIHAVQSNADYHGGIVGYNEGTVANSTSAATLTIASGVTGCQYYGAIAGYNTSGTLRDNLAIGATVPATGNSYYGAIAGRNNGGTLQRNYYTACTVDGVANATGQGCQNADVNGARHAVSIVAAEGVTIVPTGTATTYAVSGITTYEGNNGISYGGQFYAGATEQVELTLTNTATDAPAGYQYGYTASAGTLDGSTLTMPDEDVTISVNTAALAVIDWATVNAGNSTDPYMIYNKDQLDLLAHRVNGTNGETANTYQGKYFRLGADITYTYTKAWNEATTEDDNNYEAIGYYDGGEIVRSFRGDFDGAGHTISGIRIYRSGNDDADKYQGIFGLTDGANIHGLRLADARITGYDNTGGIVGNNYHGTVTDCHVASNVCIHAAQSNAWYHGGIAGDNAGTVENSTSAATLTIPTGATGCECYGAIAGNNSSTGTLRDNLAIGATVPAARDNYHGAIAGRNNNGGTLQHNYYTACTVAGAATGKGCNNADVTANDGAVPALRDQASNAQAIALLAALASTDDDRPALPLDLGWGPGQFPLQLAARTLYKDGSWNTLCLPFAVDLTASGPLSGDNVQAMTLNTSSSTFADGTLTLNFTAATSIPAGTPFIIKWDQPSDDYEPYDGQNAATCSDLVSPVFMAVTIDAEKHDATVTNVLTFTGTYAPKDIGEDGDNTMLYLGAANKLYYPTKAMTIGTHRAYFQLLGDLTAGEPVSGSNAQQIRAFNLNFGDDEATGIISVHDSGFTVHGSDGWYTLDGRKLQGEPVQRGIYVNNGRKVVIK